MAQNADDTDGNEEEISGTTGDSIRQAAEELRQIKYGEGNVEPSEDDSEDDETTGSDDDEDDAGTGADDDGKTDGESEDDASTEDASEFVKELPNIKGDTVVDYARNLESTIRESSNEGKRLADENAELKRQLATKGTGADQGNADGNTAPATKEIDINDPVALFAKQEMDARVTEAFTAFQKDYPQAVPGTTEYANFSNTVAVLTNTILQAEKRLANPNELYTKAAVILGWEKADSSPTGKEKLGMAIKGQAAVTKTSSATKTIPKSKITKAEIELNMRMYPDKTEAQIRKELEPYAK